MGALRFALLLCLRLRAQPAGRQPSPCTPPPRQRRWEAHGTQRRRQQYSTGWGQHVDSCPTPDRGRVRACSRMGQHIDGRHLGCSRTRLSSRSGAGSGPGAGGGRESGLLPRRARELVRETGGSFVSSRLDRRGVREIGRLVGLAYALARKQVCPVGSSWAHASTCVPGGVGLSSRHRGELYDSRCPSRSGRGEAPVASNRDGRRREERKPPGP